MTPKPLHWHEGLFLRPHHLQAADRFTARLVDQNTRFAQWHAWGYRRCVVDEAALGGFRFVVRELEARFRDGTSVRLPDDAPLPDIDLKPALTGRTSLDLFLAVPTVRPGQPNVASATATNPARYKVHNVPTEDENTGVNPQALNYRSYDVRVLTGDDDRSGYEVLPLARLEKADRPEATPQMAVSFIPPVLSCDCWPVLQQKILQDVYSRLNKKIEVVAGQVKSRGITFDSHSQGDSRRMHQLDRMNEGYAVLGHLGFVPGIHPIDAYQELTRLIGQLSVFGRDARPPALPRYDHDDLGTGFWKLKQYLDDLLNQVEDPAYEERPFVGSGLQMRVQLEPQWLESGWQMYLGARSNVPTEDCVKMLLRPERLGMKIGSSDRVDTIFTKGQEGLRFTHAPRPPRDLPAAPNLTYFEVSRESSTNEWAHVQKMKTLAVRIQERDVVGSIDGQKELTIRTGGQTTTFSFTLYLIPSAK
jgi:type VI secretion system protein ImpJ